MEITAAQVKELRERTGSGLMECKKALVETGGDIEAAIELMRKQGLVKAGKKAGRIAAEGIIVMRISEDGRLGAMLEVNCETDFVAKGDDFRGFAGQVLERVIADKPADIDALLALPLGAGEDGTIDIARQALIAKLGENINLRRFALFETADNLVGGYVHGTRIGVLVELQGGDAALARDVAMHIAASRPLAVSEEGIPAEVIAKEKEVLASQAAQSGKPAEIVEKMVAGKLKKYLSEATLLGQPFVKNPEITVGRLLEEAGASVVRFARFEVGEGIEKSEENFAEEVMAQVRGG